MALLFFVFVFVVWLSLFAQAIGNYNLVIANRKPGTESSVGLLYKPHLLTDEGVRALRRYWLFGIASVAWGFAGLVLGTIIFR